MIIITHKEPRPVELENKIQKGPFKKIKFLNRQCTKKENGKKSREKFESSAFPFVCFEISSFRRVEIKRKRDDSN